MAAEVIAMQIHGLNKTTLLDYPGHVAATVFCGGCNFRCPFCHNSDLVINPMSQPLISEEEILDFLNKRKNILSGVCITGGEPTLQPDLENFIQRIKDLGLLVKLDTNGYRPEIVKKLVQKGLIDYIAMDIKSGTSGYKTASGMVDFEWNNIKESIDFIMNSGVQYEFRTTVVNGIHKKEDFEEIAQLIKGCDSYFLQNYKDNENVITPGFTGFSKGELETFADIVRPYVGSVTLRGID